MNKAFSNFQWENDPSVNTPLSAENLNKVNNALNEVDNRVVSHDTTKANQTEMLTAFTDVALDKKTGEFIFTRHNGTKVVLDTKLEKLILNWRFDTTAQILYLILEDGSEMPIDLSAFITNYEFVDSTTIRAVIGTDGKVAFEIIDGTITGSKLEPNYLANIQVEATKASASATSAELSAQNAESSAVRAEKAAEDAQAAVGGDYATNSRVDDIVSGATTVGNAENLDGHDSDYFAKNTDLANYYPKTGGTVSGDLIAYTNDDSVRTVSVANAHRTVVNRVYANGLFQMYDNTNKKAIIVSDADGTNTFNGTASGNLPLSGGGTVKKANAAPIVLDNTSSNTSLTGYSGTNGMLGYLGFNGADNPVYVNSAFNTVKSLHHDGNSAKVAIQSSAPSDTSALWVY